MNTCKKLYYILNCKIFLRELFQPHNTLNWNYNGALQTFFCEFNCYLRDKTFAANYFTAKYYQKFSSIKRLQEKEY